jgi:hypothetical protein
MALQTTSATSSLLRVAPSDLRLGGRVAQLGRGAWGVAAGLLFLLAFPLAVVLAPVLWAIGRAQGRPDLD